MSNVPVDEFVQEMSKETKELIIQSTAVNFTAFKGVQDGNNTFIGSKTEVALLLFSRERLAARPVQQERENANIIQQIPFNSANKFMATIIKLPNGKFRAYVKGASEIVLDTYTRIIAGPSGELSSIEMTDTDRKFFKWTIASYADQTLRTIGSTYRDFDTWPPEGASSQEDPHAAHFAKIHQNMTLLTIFGIKDPLRLPVIDALKDC